MIRKAKSIDELFNEVMEKGCTLAITNEISLATALNNRLTTSRIGPFALTPRQIARESSIEITGKPMMDDSDAIDMILRDEGIRSEGVNKRYILGEIQNYREIYRFSPNPMDYIYTKSSKNICDKYRTIENTIESVMTNPKIKDCRLYKDNKRIAVIGRELFNCIDTKSLPDDAIDIEPFHDGMEADVSDHPVYRIGNDMQIAKHISDLIDRGNAGSFAVIFNPETNLLPSLKTQFHFDGIDYIDKPPISDLYSVRDYLNVLEQSLRYNSLERIDVTQILDMWGLPCYMPADGSKFTSYTSRRDSYKLDSIKNIMRRIYGGKCTFSEAADSIYESDITKKGTIHLLLQTLGMGDTYIDEESVRDLRYLSENLADIDTKELDQLSSKKGVLLVNCKNSTYVDRPNVIICGMEQDWDIKLTGKRYITDRTKEQHKNADRLAILLQQGVADSRLYITHKTVSGQVSKPALTFFEVCDRDISGFKDIFKEELNGWIDRAGC